MRRALAAALLLAGGCITVDFGDGNWRCGSGGACPPGQFCHSDGICYKQAETAGGADAMVPGAPDAMVAGGPDARPLPTDAKVAMPPDGAAPDAPVAQPDAMVEPDATVIVTLQVTITGNGTVTFDPPGESCGAACTRFPAASGLNIHAHPAIGQRTARWGDSCSPSDDLSSCFVLLNADTSASVAFEGGATLHERAITMTGSGTSLSSIAVDPQGAVIVGGTFAGSVDFGDGTVTGVQGRDAFIAKYSSNGALLWKHLLHESDTSGSIYLAAVTTDGTGRVFATGNFTGTVDFGPGPAQSGGGSFVLNLFVAGGDNWVKVIPTLTADRAVADSAGNVYVTGQYAGTTTVDATHTLPQPAGILDTWTGKLKADGSGFVWVVPMGVDGGVGTGGLAFDRTNDVVAESLFSGSVTLGGTKYDAPAQGIGIAIVRYRGGAYFASTVIPDVTKAYVYSAIDKQSNLFLTGTFSGQMKLGSGTFTASSNGDLFIAKLDSAHNPTWIRQYPQPQFTTSFNGITIDQDGNPVAYGTNYPVAMDFGGGLTRVEGWGPIVKLDADGSYRWARGVPELAPLLGAAAPDGTVWLGGIFSDAGVNNPTWVNLSK
jgi:hypothetical protein